MVSGTNYLHFSGHQTQNDETLLSDRDRPSTVCSVHYSAANHGTVSTKDLGKTSSRPAVGVLDRRSPTLPLFLALALGEMMDRH